MVYKATPRDPVVFVGLMLTMTLFGLIVTWVPARRAIGFDPVGLLREE
jgi:ABC-type lipoprotein release transport system permease subunit